MLNAFVKLYRELDSPPLQDGGLLEFHCNMDSQTLTLINDVVTSGIEVEEIEQGNNFLSLDEIELNSGEALVTLKIPTNGEYNIFRDIEDLLDRAVELRNGKKIPDFYVCEDNYWHAEKGRLSIEDKYQNLNDYCELVEGLEKLASYHDKKQNGLTHELVFISNDESTNSKPVVLRPNLNVELLKLPLLDISIINALVSDETDKVPNINRERAIFKVSIIEFFETVALISSEQKFIHLVKNWNEFILLYNNNFETYMSGFAFHKAKKEVADVELQVAEQYSKVLGDIAGKLFGLPVSFAALLGFFAEKATFVSDALIIVSIIAASWLMTRLVANQLAQLARITHAKNISFGSIEGKSTQYPTALQQEIKSAKDAIDLNANRLKRDLTYLSTLVWAPLAIGIGLFWCRHQEQLKPVLQFLKTVYTFSVSYLTTYLASI